MYFPTSAIVSLSYVMVDGNPAEIAVIGNEGVVGVAVFLADASTPSRAVVQHAGWAYSLTGTFLQQEFIRRRRLQQLLLHYIPGADRGDYAENRDVQSGIIQPTSNCVGGCYCGSIAWVPTNSP